MTPKYYIGQKVIFDSVREGTVVDIRFDIKKNNFEYFVYYGGESKTGTQTWLLKEQDLTRPPTKLEFGYCAVGDVFEDDDHELVTIEAIGKNMFAYNWFGGIKWILYEEADDKGWEIKEEDSPEEKIEEAKRLLSNLQGYKDYMVGELNGVKYKISLLEE